MKIARSAQPSQQPSIIKFVLRLSVDLRNALAILAQKHHRSLNAEIVHLLQSYLDAGMAETADSEQLLATTAHTIGATSIIEEIFQTLPKTKRKAIIQLLISLDSRCVTALTKSKGGVDGHTIGLVEVSENRLTT